MDCGCDLGEESSLHLLLLSLVMMTIIHIVITISLITIILVLTLLMRFCALLVLGLEVRGEA